MKLLVAASAAALMLGIAACTPSQRADIDEAATDAGDATRDAMNEAGEVTRDTAGAVGDTTQDAYNAAQGAAQDTAAALMPSTPTEYVQRAAMSDMYEIEASRIAAERTQDEQVRTFANDMIMAHTETSDQLKTIAQNDNTLTVPTALDERHMEMLETLRSAQATEFDERYLEQQEMAHEEALRVHQSFADGDGSPQLRAFAAETAPVVESHLTRVRAMTDAMDDAGGASNRPEL